MIHEIEAAHPRYLVYSRVVNSWLPRKDSSRRILDWGKAYVNRCYDRVGVADIISEEETRMVWDDEARSYANVSENLVYTFRRKSDAPCSVSE
jgi:hypothetical protein